MPKIHLEKIFNRLGLGVKRAENVTNTDLLKKAGRHLTDLAKDKLVMCNEAARALTVLYHNAVGEMKQYDDVTVIARHQMTATILAGGVDRIHDLISFMITLVTMHEAGNMDTRGLHNAIFALHNRVIEIDSETRTRYTKAYTDLLGK